MKTLTKIILIISFLLLTVNYSLLTANAAVPHLINYQGRLTDSGGIPLNGSYELTFRIYDAETAGNLLWEETHSSALIQKGIFSVLLGSVTNLDLAFDQPYFLEIKVGSEVMTPRQRMASSGYAIRAEEANSLSEEVILMCKDSCPPGYKKIGALDGKFLVGGTSYNTSAGGSNTHSHSFSGTTQGYVGTYRHWDGDSHDINQPEDAAKGTHNHNFSGTTASGDSRPEFATVILCEKE